MGFNQRQAGGRFTRDEAAAFIEQLEDTTPEPTAVAERHRPSRPPSVVAAVDRNAGGRSLRGVPAEQMAEELRRRGWMVIEPLQVD
jgi:hypothetical protein